MALLGLPFGTKAMAGGRVAGRNQFRKFLFEPLEERRVMAIGVTIDANDTPPVEGGANGQFSVFLYDTVTNLPLASVGNTTITYAVTGPGATQATPTGAPGGGTFANPFDYTALSGVVTILNGSTKGLINVIVIDDATTEVAANERVEVTLLTADNSAILGGLGFPATSPGPGVAPLGTKAEVVTIGDNDPSTLSVSATDGTIAPEGTGAPSADTGTFKFTLSKASSIPTNVWLNVPQSNPTNALFTTDWTAVLNNGATLVPGSESRTVTSKSILSDIVTIVTSAPHNYITGQQVNYTGFGGGNYAGDSTVTATVVNATTFTFPRGAAVPDTAATAGGTISTVSNALLSIPAGVTEVTVTVSAVADTVVEQNETIVLNLATLKGPGGAVLASLPTLATGAAATATVTITDDDAATITLSPASDLLGDDTNTGPGASTTFPTTGNNASFVAQISAPSSQNVVIPYTISAAPAHAVTLISNDFSNGLTSAIGPAIATAAGGGGTINPTFGIGGNNGNVLNLFRTNSNPMTSANQAQFTVNLAAMKTTGGAVLTFDQIKGTENADNAFSGLTVADAFIANPDVDGVAISVNGTTWFPVLNLGATSTGTIVGNGNGIGIGGYNINLERALYERGLEANLGTVSVRFLQFDSNNSSNTTSGRQFDNIRVVSGDYLTLSGTATISGDSVSTTAAINVNVLNDLVVEGSENVTITLGTPVVANPSTIKLDTFAVNLTQTAVITDSDTAVALLENAGNGNENGGPLNGTFRVRLTNAGHTLPMRSDTDTTFTFQLDPAFPSPAATYGTDYTIGGTNVTFNPLTGKGTVKLLAGETATTITVIVVNDTEVEDDELVSLRLLNTVGVDPIVGDPQIGLPSGAAVGLTTNVSIQDEDSALIRVSSVAPGSEPGSSGVFVVDLVRTLDQINTLLPVQNVISNVNTVITYTVNVASTAQAGAAPGGGNDYLTLTTLGTGTVTITAGQSFAFVPITVFDDLLLEPTETVIINLLGKLAGDASTIIHPTHNAATVNILDNDTLAVKVVRDVANVLTNSVTTATINGTGTATITSPAHNLILGQEVIINLTGNPGGLNGTYTVLSATTNTFTVSNAGAAFGPSGALPGTITTFDARESTANALGSDVTDGRFTIFLDNSNPGALAQYQTSRLAFANQNIVVNYTLTGLASNGIDYQTIPLSATILPGQSSVSVLVDVINDLLFDPSETVTLTITSVPTQPALGLGGLGIQPDATPATVKIVDDEGGLVTISTIVPARESNTNGAVTFTLPAASPFNTLVTYSVTPFGPAPIATQGADHNFFSGTVTFLAGQTSQTVVVPVLNDTTKEDVEFIPVQITGFAPGGNGGGFGFDPALKQVPILADQTVDIVNSINNREGASVATVTTRTLSNNVVTLTTNAPHNFVPGQTITVTGANGTNLNGTFVVQTATSTTLSYISFGAAISGTQAGTVTPVSASFTIGMQAPSTAATVVTYQVVQPTDATSGSDFTALALTATIAAGQTTVLVPVSVIDDTNIENTESLSIKLLTVSNIDDPDISIGAAAQSSTTNDAQSISVINRSSTASGPAGIVTLTTARPHGLVVGQQINVTGVGTGFDSIPGVPVTVTNVSGSTFTYFAPGATGAVAPVASGGSFSRTASAINKSLTSNVATITTNATHGFLVGQPVLVSILDPVFDGTYVITAATATTFSYARTNANVASTSFGPLVNAVVLDAGSLPASATSISGSFSNQKINGTLSAADVQDMYLIRIDNPAAFTANTLGSSFDTQLFLFQASGFGVTSDDNSAGGGLSSLTSPLPIPTPGLPAISPGFYYIAIAGGPGSTINSNPTSSGFGIWISNNNIAPNGVGALGPVNGWLAGPAGVGAPGAYTINLAGASFVDYDTTASLSIFDNDSGFIQVSSTNGNENGAVAITFTITQSGISSTDTVVRYTLGTTGATPTPAGGINLNFANPNGTNADVSVDYSTTPATTYTATIAAGTTSVVITVPVVDDLVVESDTEQVTLSLLDGAPISGDPQIQYGTANGPTLVFQQGAIVNGVLYTGTVDTFINNDIQAQSYETQNFISVSPLLPPSFPGGPLHGLIRFDNFVGSNLIPTGSRLQAATLVFNGAFTNTAIPGPAVQPSIFQLQPGATWPAAGATWAGNFGGNGIQANGVEAAAQFVTGAFTSSSISTFTSTGGTNGTSVLAVVQSWVNGTVNNGWAILPGNVGWDANSSESGGIRPALSVTIATSATASITDNDSAKISITSLNGAEPGGPLFLAPAVTVSTVSHDGTLATVTTSGAHGMIPGQSVRIATGDTRFDGTFVLGAGTGGSTIVYANANPAIATTTAGFLGTPTAQLVNLIGQANAGRAIVSIDKPSSSNTFVTYTITDGTALGGGVDYTAPTTTQTLTIPAGQTSATIFIEVNDDFTVEGQEDVVVTLLAIPTNTSAATNDDTDPQITFDVVKTTKVNINDNDVGNISITSIVNGSENNPDPRNVVNKVLTSNIATITTSGGAHTFIPGEQVLVSIGDPIFDGEYVVLAAPAPTANTFSYIRSNLDVPSTVVASGTAANQPTDGKFLISTTNASNTPTLIPYSIVLNSPVLNNATIGQDYVLRANNTVLTGTITLPALVTSVEVTIDVLEDFLNEGDENVTIQLLAPTGKLSLGAPTIATAKILDDDKLLVLVNVSDDSVTEGADAGPLDGAMQLFLNYVSDSDVYITYVVGGTATPGSPQSPIYTNGNDYIPLPGTGGVTKTVTIPAGSFMLNLPVEVYEDFFAEGNETVTATIDTIETLEPGTNVVSNNSIDKGIFPGMSTGKVTIVDEAFTVTIARTDSPPTEPGLFGPGGSNGQFTATLSNKLPSPLVVVIQDTTAVALGKATLGTGVGADYNYSGSTSKFQTVTIQPGQTQATLTITVLDDLLSEGDETIDVGISSISYVPSPFLPTIGAPNTAQATIFDNDVMNVTISATNGRDKIGGKDDGLFTFSTSGVTSASNTVVTYQVKATGTTATFGADYSAPTLSVGTFTLTPGQTTATVALTVIDDTDVEGDETVQLEILTVTTPGPNAVGGVGNVGTATIFDDDVATLKITGTANASEPSGLGFFTVEQSAKSSTNTVISFSVTGGTATQGAGNDYATITPLSVTITAGQTQAFIPIQALDDLIVEANPETVELTLANTTTSSDPQITVGASKVSTIGIFDNDVAKVLFAKVQDGAEGGANGSFNVSLVDATSLTPLSSDLNVIVTYEISGTATGGADYQQLSVSKIGTVTILATQTSATISVNVIDDDIVEATLENVTIRQLTVSTASPRAISLNTQSAVVTNKLAGAGLATLTAANSFTAGQLVVVSIGDPLFDGTFAITFANATSFQYANGNTVGSTATSGLASITTPVGTTIPATSQINSQSLTSNVVTMITTAAHGLLPGQIVTIALNPANPIYDGTFILLPGTSGAVLLYGRAFADQGATGFAGTVTNRSEANLLISDNDSSTLTIDSSSLNEGNNIFDQAGATLKVSLSKAFDVPTTWTVNYLTAPNAVAAVSNKELTSNVATLTIPAHTFAVGQRITVALTPADPVFDGQFIISAVTGTTVSYVKANANVASVATAGSLTVSGGATAGVADNLFGTDFDGTADTVTIPAGALSGSVKVDFNEEGPPNSPQTNLVEDNELFLTNVTGTLPAGYVVTNNGKGTVTILNDDTATYLINDATVDELDPAAPVALIAGNKSLTAGVATLTTGAAHGFTVGTTVEVAFAAPADAIFNGRYYVASATTLTAPNANADVVSVAYGAGTVTTFPQASLSFQITVNNPVDMPINLLVNYTDVAGVLGAKGANYNLLIPVPAGTDYNSAPGGATFGAVSTTPQLVTVQVNSDMIVEGGTVDNPGSETFTAGTALNPTSFAVIPQGGRLFNNADTGIGTIRDANGANPDSASVNISVIDGLGAETNPAGLNQASYRISQTNPSSVDTVIKLSIATGGILNATQGSDYLLKVGTTVVTDTVTILAGQTEIILTVDVLNDSILEDDEFVDITMSSFVSRDPNVSFGTSVNGKIRIDDNDSALLSVTASDPTGSEPGTDDAAFTVSLTALSDSDTVVSYHVLGPLEAGFVGPAATPGFAVPLSGDYVTLSGTVTIPAGQLSAVILVDVLNDFIVEGTEFVSIKLDAFTGNADIMFSAPLTATVSITDATNGLFVKVEKVKDGAEPGNGPDDGQFRVTLVNAFGVPVIVPIGSTGTAGGLQVNFALNEAGSGGTAVSPTDYVNATVVVIPEGATSALVTIDVQDDFVPEPTETVKIRLLGTALSNLNGVPVTVVGGVPIATSVGNALFPNLASLDIVDNDGPVGAFVVSRGLFYNSSSFDNNGAAIDTSGPTYDDFDAIAVDKNALLPGGTASFINYTSYSKGINGIIVDIASLASTPTFPTLGSYFQFRVGNGNTAPNTWTPAPAATSVTVLPSVGNSGSTRVLVTWADNTIQKQWLQVIVLANASTGLSTRDVHYWGNAIAETGTISGNLAIVDSTDSLLANSSPSGFVLQPITNIYDFNRDKIVNSTDFLIANSNPSGFSPLVLFTAPASGSGGEGEVAPMMVLSPIPTNNSMPMIGSRMIELEEGQFYGPMQASAEQAVMSIGSETENSQIAMIIDDIAEKSAATSDAYIGSLDALFGNDNDDELFGL